MFLSSFSTILSFTFNFILFIFLFKRLQKLLIKWITTFLLDWNKNWSKNATIHSLLEHPSWMKFANALTMTGSWMATTASFDLIMQVPVWVINSHRNQVIWGDVQVNITIYNHQNTSSTQCRHFRMMYCYLNQSLNFSFPGQFWLYLHPSGRSLVLVEIWHKYN